MPNISDDGLSWLLRNALIPGATSGSDSGRSFRIKPTSGETWLVMRLDSPTFRARFFGQVNVTTCDFLVVGFLSTGPAFALIELKGGDKAHACKQLDSTLKALASGLSATWKGDDIQWHALIVGKGSAPRDLASEQKRFRVAHRTRLTSISQNDADVASVIRTMSSR